MIEEPQIIIVIKALADPMRLEILAKIAGADQVAGGEIQATCPRSQPTISHHLAKLVEAGIVTEVKSGTQKLYAVDHQLLASVGIDLPKLISNLSVTHSHGDPNPRRDAVALRRAEV